jgi:hypothetical protein
MALNGGFPRLAPAGAGDKGAQARTKRAPVCSLLSSRLRRCYGLTGEFADLHPKADNANPTLTSALVVRRADGLACLIVAISQEFPLAGIQASSGSARTPKPPVAQEAAPKLATLCDQSTCSRG